MPARLVALRPMSYRTRRLQADEQFEAWPEREARLLVAIRKARWADDGEHAEVPKPPMPILKAAAAVTPPPPTPPAPAAPPPPAPAPAEAPAEDAAPNPVPATAPAATRATKGRGAQPE
jgi:hypothetical protein